LGFKGILSKNSALLIIRQGDGFLVTIPLTNKTREPFLLSHSSADLVPEFGLLCPQLFVLLDLSNMLLVLLTENFLDLYRGIL